MSVYEVLSPKWTEVDPVLDDGSGPLMEMREYLVVRARNAGRAKALALKTWRRRDKLSFVLRDGRFRRNELRGWRFSPWWLYEENPFNGMIVRKVGDISVLNSDCGK